MAQTSPILTGTDALKERIRTTLERIRERTLELIEPLSDSALNAVHDPLLSPIAWDLGHIANFEDLWLAQRAGGCRPLREELGGLYDPFTAPRRERSKLPYLRSEDCIDYMRAVRERTLECLEQADLSGSARRLLAGGFVYDMIARHEQQHSETVLQTLQVMTGEAYAPRDVAEVPTSSAPCEGMVLVDEGPFEIGAKDEWFAYDNERPAHVRRLDPFWIDAGPVTNGEMIEFILAGGYERRSLWSDRGWSWREREGVTLPKYWQREGDRFFVRAFAQTEPADPAKPICHVSWYEADAYARWAGKRLPTEAEWERAASWSPEALEKRRYPWGDQEPNAGQANLDQLRFGPSPVGSYPEGASAYGVQQALGDVWEWTASGFEAYPGFEAFPYNEYSEAFFGGPFKVLRGGAWATQPEAVTTSFRNWDYPERRQIFSGFRCARDADD